MTFDGTLGPAAYTLPSSVFEQPRLSLRSRTFIPDPQSGIPGPNAYSPRRALANTACKIRPDYYKSRPPELNPVGPGRYEVERAQKILSAKPGQSLGGGGMGFEEQQEWMRQRHGDTPGPNFYILPGAEAPQNLTIRSRVERSLRATCGTAAETPGPGAYDAEVAKEAQRTRPPSFSMRWRPEGFSTEKQKRSELPGPGEYSPEPVKSPRRAPTFGASRRPLSSAEMLRIPGPGTYNPVEDMHGPSFSLRSRCETRKIGENSPGPA